MNNNVQIHSDHIIIEGELVTLSNIDLGEIVAQFSNEDLLQAIAANDGYSDILDYVTESEQDKQDEGK